MVSKKTNDTFYTIGEVSQQTKIKPYILRYWEKEFPFLQPIKNKVGHRLYTPRDLYIINTLKDLIYRRGYSIAGAKKAMWRLLLNNNSSSPAYNKIEEIKEIKKVLREALEVLNKSLQNSL